MKKIMFILGSVVALFGLTAYGYMNWNTSMPLGKEGSQAETQPIVFQHSVVNTVIDQVVPDFVYKVDSRFVHTITQEHLHTATTIREVLPEEATHDIAFFQTVKVAILQEEGETKSFGEGEALTPGQLQLLQTLDYSTHFYIKAYYQKRDEYTGKQVDDYLVYYMTVTPEHEAEYSEGFDELITYLKVNSQRESAIVTKDKLEPGTISFTITEEGNITSVTLTSSSGYPELDEKMKELIRTLPGTWKPATNALGEKVDQEFIFFFGQEGC